MNELPTLFRRLFFDRKALSATDPAMLSLFGASRTLAGVSVGASAAMRVPAVAAAVRLTSQLVGTLPAKLFVRDGEGRSPDLTNPAYRLVHDEANDFTSATELRTQLTADALLNDAGGFA